jgi:ATP-binding cassette, subfamily B (MDR/TAP), member 1
MRTVAALSLERQRLDDYNKVVDASEPNVVFDTLLSGIAGGISMFIQQWANALLFWFGGWILHKYPDKYELKDFMIANFAILFSLFGLGSAFQDISDRKEVEKSAGRIFYLLDRESKIDPLSTSGLNLDGKVTDFTVRQEEAAVERSPVTKASPSMARPTEKDFVEEEVFV